MKQFASFLFSYFLLIVISGSSILGMQRQPAKFFPGVPSREKDLVEWLEKSKIPQLKALIARHIYRDMCNDVIYTKKVWTDSKTPEEVRHDYSISRGDGKSFASVCKYF